VSEQDQHLEPQQGEEDVEAHANKNRNLAKDENDVEAHANKNRNAGKDEDVEGHMQLNQQLGHTKGHEDTDDDVEAHRNLNQNKF